MIGQDAVNTAQAFLDGVGFDGVVLTKLDGDARGGAALSVASITGQPIMFASTGEKLDDFDVFHPDRMAGRILDMGDMLTLIEQAEKTFDQEQAAKVAAKLTGQGGDFTLDDFLEQMQQIRKMGSLSKILGMLPGMGQLRDQLDNIDEREIDRIQAIIQSMTPAERDEPEDHQRLAPAADRQGLRHPGLRRQQPRRPVLRGPQDDDVRWPRAAASPGCRACPGWAASAAASGARASRRRRRARPSAARATPPSARRSRRPRRPSRRAATAANPFGLPQGEDQPSAEDFQLPAEFSKYLPKQ